MSTQEFQRNAGRIIAVACEKKIAANKSRITNVTPLKFNKLLCTFFLMNYALLTVLAHEPVIENKVWRSY